MTLLEHVAQYSRSIPFGQSPFATPKGSVTARIVNTPENISAENCDQRWFRISFSDGRNVMIVLSDTLLDDPDGSYQAAALDLLQGWLDNGGPPTIEL